MSWPLLGPTKAPRTHSRLRKEVLALGPEVRKAVRRGCRALTIFP